MAKKARQAVWELGVKTSGTAQAKELLEVLRKLETIEGKQTPVKIWGDLGDSGKLENIKAKVRTVSGEFKEISISAKRAAEAWQAHQLSLLDGLEKQHQA